jgi:hypothetical protein
LLGAGGCLDVSQSYQNCILGLMAEIVEPPIRIALRYVQILKCYYAFANWR